MLLFCFGLVVHPLTGYVPKTANGVRCSGSSFSFSSEPNNKLSSCPTVYLISIDDSRARFTTQVDEDGD